LIAGLLALRLGPALLKPPEPPPLAADVGLQGVAVERVPEHVPERRAPDSSKDPGHVRRQPAPPRQRRRLEPKIGSKPKPRPKQKAAEKPAPPQSPPAIPAPPPTPEPPAPAPQPAPSPAPAPAPPPPPDDGSAEFAPH